MKKSIFAKSLSLLLALLIACGISSAASAEDAPEVTIPAVSVPANEAVTEAPQPVKAAEDAPEVITIPVSARVGEIYTDAQLRELVGPPEFDVYLASADEAIRWGTTNVARKPGQATMLYKTRDNSKHYVLEFTISANPDAITAALTVQANHNIPVDAELTKFGYTLNDMKAWRCWDTKVMKGKSGNIHRSDEPQFTSNVRGEGQILLNMNDGKVILLNITVEKEKLSFFQTIKEVFMSVFVGPFALAFGILLAMPYLFPLILLAPLMGIGILYDRFWPWPTYEYPYEPLVI